jgi:Uma2 family endonuclease
MGIMRPPRKIVYPESDGQPMADNTLQYRWIVTIKEGLERVFPGPADAFIAGDLFWYPVEGHPEIVLAPDVLVALGRPKGDRGSYMQWEEDGIAPQVVFEVLSPSNCAAAMNTKFKFYERHGVQEYYIYDPDKVELTGYERDGDELKKIPELDGWNSPRLGIRFDLSVSEMVIYGPDGQRFLTYQELADERDQAVQDRDQAVQQRDQAVQQRDQLAQDRDQAVQQRDQLAQDRDQLVQDRDQLVQQRDAERQRAERMAAQLRAMGIEPPS